VAVASAGLYASLHLIPDNTTNIPPLSFFTGRMPFLPPNQQRQGTEGNEADRRTTNQYNSPERNNMKLIKLAPIISKVSLLGDVV